MEPDTYKSWRLGPFEFGFENEWVGKSGVLTYFLLGMGRDTGGIGIGVCVAGISFAVSIWKDQPPVESLGREHGDGTP